MRRSPVGRLLAPSLVFLWGQASATTPVAGTRRLLLDLAPSLVPLLRSLGQVRLHVLLRPYGASAFSSAFPPKLQVLSRVGSPLVADEKQKWLQQLERLLALLGGLAIAAQLRPESTNADADALARHARWLDGREGGSNGILATLPAPELLGAILSHVSIADDFRASLALSPATTVTAVVAVVAGCSPRTTAAAIATPPRASTRKTLLAPRLVVGGLHTALTVGPTDHP